MEEGEIKREGERGEREMGEREINLKAKGRSKSFIKLDIVRT